MSYETSSLLVVPMFVLLVAFCAVITYVLLNEPDSNFCTFKMKVKDFDNLVEIGEGRALSTCIRLQKLALLCPAVCSTLKLLKKFTKYNIRYGPLNSRFASTLTSSPRSCSCFKTANDSFQNEIVNRKWRKMFERDAALIQIIGNNFSNNDYLNEWAIRC